jgi:hypothetical protein
LLLRIFDNFPSTLTKEEDLAKVEKAINEIYPQFLELIKEAKQSQNGKPDELTGQTGGGNQDGSGGAGNVGGGGQGGSSSQILAELEQITQSELNNLNTSQRRNHIIEKIENYVRKHNISVDEALGSNSF